MHCHFGDRAGVLKYVEEAVQHGYSVGLLHRNPELAPLRDDPEFRRIVEEESRAYPHSQKGGTS